jgi:hypothetical protein
MSNNGIVQIHGRDYMTVARRIELAHENHALESIKTEVLCNDPVVVKAEVTIKGQVYTGISAVSLDSSRMIDRQNPYEVAETSAVGRALGFAGYGLIESVASADDMARAVKRTEQQQTRIAGSAAGVASASSQAATLHAEQHQTDTATCEVCGAPATEKTGKTKAGKQYHGIFCSTENRSHTRWLWN